MTRTQRFTLAATGLGLFMIFLDALIVNVALPAIQSDFHVGESGLQWVVTAYSLGMAVAIMSAGTLADIYGRRRLYFAGIALFTAASAACGMASSLDVLNLARAIQGVAAATVNVTSLALVSAAFPEPKLKAWAIGIWTAIASTAIVDRADPRRRDGGADRLAQRSSWSTFRSGVVVLLLTWRFVAESKDARPRTFDVPGQLLFIAAVGAFAFAVIEGPRAGWVSAEILGLFLASGLALAGFVVWERRSGGPDDGPDALPRPHVHAGDRDDLRRAVRDLRDAARDHAVPAERARLLADGRRPAAAAVQRERDARLAAGGQARGLGGLAAAHPLGPRDRRWPVSASSSRDCRARRRSSSSGSRRRAWAARCA